MAWRRSGAVAGGGTAKRSRPVGVETKRSGCRRRDGEAESTSWRGDEAQSSRTMTGRRAKIGMARERLEQRDRRSVLVEVLVPVPALRGLHARRDSHRRTNSRSTSSSGRGDVTMQLGERELGDSGAAGIAVVDEDRRLSGVGWIAIDTPPTSHRSQIANSGSRPISACSAACTAPMIATRFDPGVDQDLDRHGVPARSGHELPRREVKRYDLEHLVGRCSSSLVRDEAMTHGNGAEMRGRPSRPATRVRRR